MLRRGRGRKPGSRNKTKRKKPTIPDPRTGPQYGGRYEGKMMELPSRTPWCEATMRYNDFCKRGFEIPRKPKPGDPTDPNWDPNSAYNICKRLAEEIKKARAEFYMQEDQHRSSEEYNRKLDEITRQAITRRECSDTPAGGVSQPPLQGAPMNRLPYVPPRNARLLALANEGFSADE